MSNKELESDIEKTMQRLYLSYVNDFLTVSKFAEHYGLSEKGARTVINEGRKINEREAQNGKR